MTDDPRPKDDDRLNQLNAKWRRDTSDLVGLVMAQNTMIALLLEKMIERKTIDYGDAFSLLEECLAAYVKDEAAQVPPKWVLDFLRRRFVPPPGSH
jgi:hypothetical protein